jgi:hypothetical protein
VNFEGCVVVALVASAALAGSGADEHVLAGARHFRAGRFGEALVEFRVAEKTGRSDEAAWYVAACLAHLKRSSEAVEAFAEAERRAPHVRDEVLDYYHAVACSDARLYVCADNLLAGVGARAGPRIRAQAKSLRAGIEAMLRPEPGRGTIDWYHLRAAEAEKRGQPLLVRAYLSEAAALSARRKDRYRLGEAAQGASSAPASREQVQREPR